MNQDEMEGKWNQIKGRVRDQFGKLTDDDLEQVQGKRDRLLGKLQERYGETREDSEKRLKEFESSI